jgi:hypothetical protein
MGKVLDLRREYGRFITSGAQLSLIWLGSEIDHPIGWAFCAGGIAVVSLIAWTSTYRRSRAIDDTPTSKIESAAQGYTELVGRGCPLGGEPLISPQRHVRCLWYRYLVERREKDSWVTESYGESDASFLIDDGTGECLVDPAGSDLMPKQKESWTHFDHRYTEWTLMPEEQIYVLGQFETKNGADLGFDREAAFNEILTDWKRHPQELLKRFDLDGNDEIDMKEWQLARAEAKREVQKMANESTAAPGINTMRRPEDGRLYLISSLSPEQLSRRYRWWSIAHIALFFGGLAGAVTALKMAV